MGIVRALTVGEGIALFLGTLDHSGNVGTRRVYALTLRQLRDYLGAGAPLAVLDEPGAASALAVWFTGRWGQRAPATFNRNLDTLRSAAGYWRDQGWIVTEPTAEVRRRGRAPAQTRTLSRAAVAELVTRENVDLRERVLWWMLYETAARASEVLALDVEDLDLRHRCAPVHRRRNAVAVIIWRAGTARLLPQLLMGREAGPVFRTDRGTRLAYRRAADIFNTATDGATLHQLRHSALTHAAEDGANTSTLLAYSGLTSVASLARYTRLSARALAQWQLGDEAGPQPGGASRGGPGRSRGEAPRREAPRRETSTARGNR
ncbi:site-specific integrase [Frankia sp. R43]|uniref:tyrosine-type recombinase/integrase n=1 Tax=Frankia sp. R43 TaxID=269536 RepID=UPI0007C76996|nr:site-specific integrase [Frankia sp. R43]